MDSLWRQNCRQFPGAVEYPPNIDGSLIHRSPRMAINGWFFRVEKTGRRRPRPKNSPSAMDPWSTWRIWRDGGAMWQGRAAKQIRSSSFSNPTMLDGLGLFRNLREKLLTFWDALSQIRGSQSPTWISVHVCILGLAGMMHEVSWLINQLGHLYRRLMNRTGGRCAPLRMRRDYGCVQIISSNQLHQWRFFLAAWSLDIRILGWSNIFKHDQIDPTSQIHIFGPIIPKYTKILCTWFMQIRRGCFKGCWMRWQEPTLSPLKEALKAPENIPIDDIPHIISPW